MARGMLIIRVAFRAVSGFVTLLYLSSPSYKTLAVTSSSWLSIGLKVLHCTENPQKNASATCQCLW